MDRPLEKKIKNIFVPLAYTSYELFKHKCYSEGYSMKKVIEILVEQYTNDKLVVKK